MSELFGATFERVEGAMRFRVARQSVLSGNVANADTPGYRRFDLKVDELLQDTPLSRTDARHLNAGGLNAKDWNIERGDFVEVDAAALERFVDQIMAGDGAVDTPDG